MNQFLLHITRKQAQILQFVRYVVIGCIMLLVNLLLVWWLVQFGHFHYLVATSIAFVIESVLAFFANRRWTFRTDIHFKTWYTRFVTIAFYSFLAVLFVTYGLVHFLAFHYVWARTVSTVITGFIGYFLDMKITFRVQVPS